MQYLYYYKYRNTFLDLKFWWHGLNDLVHTVWSKVDVTLTAIENYFKLAKSSKMKNEGSNRTFQEYPKLSSFKDTLTVFKSIFYFFTNNVIVKS